MASRYSTQSQGQSKTHNGIHEAITRTKILLLGLRRSGKTSILQVLFNDLPPKQTFFLETTIRIAKHTIDSVIPIEIWDCPGNMTVETLGVSLSQFSSIIFVIDVRDLYQHPISRLIDFLNVASSENPNINFEVFVHKTEKLTEDDKLENFRHVQERVFDRLLDVSPEFDQDFLSFYPTSVYDHSVYEAFSRVLHKVIASLPYLEELLNVFCANSQCPKAFLFDVKSRLYIATDASPVDSDTHHLCCDHLQMLNSIAPLYKSTRATETHESVAEDANASPSSPSPSGLSDVPASSKNLSPTIESTTASPKTLSLPPKPLTHPSAAAVLSGSTTLTYHLMTPHLALIALLPTAVYERRRGLVEYNVVFLREGVREIWAVEWERRGGG